MKPLVAIVGRPNVGKSTLFNRLIGSRTAIVEDTPGVTRDRLYGDAEWENKVFTVIDTGGIETGKNDKMLDRIKKQAEMAIEEADIILFVVDGRAGVSLDDQEIALMLRKTNKNIILVVNKIEDYSKPDQLFDFYTLGLGEPYPISASHGMNTGDLMEKIVSYFPDNSDEIHDPDTIKMAVVGRPNVGKSSLVNTIIGRERVIVSDIPGTTRDAIDSTIIHNNQQYVIIDTAGIRRKGKIFENTERYSVIRSLRAVDRSNVVLMVIDAKEGVTEQDKRIVGYAHEQGKGIVLVINKWDLIEKDEKTLHKFEKKIRDELLFLHYAPIIFISAKTGQRVNKILDIVDFVAEQQNHRVTTSALNEVIKEATQLNPTPSDKGKRLKIFYATQASVAPPTFVMFVNEPELLHFSYRRFIENKIRESFGFQGTPIHFIVRKRNEEY